MRVNRLVVLVAVTVLLGAAGCRKQPTQTADDNAGSVQCSPLLKYFPFGGETGAGSLFFGQGQADWEGRLLAYLKEPPLYSCGVIDNSDEYRFLWDRSLSEPIAVRLAVKPDGSGKLFVRMLEHGGLLPSVEAGEKYVAPDEWYKLKLDRQVDLSVEQVRQLTDMFRVVFHLPDNPRHVGETTDGSDWVFESRINGRYRVKDFRNKQPEAARTLGLLMALTLGQVPLTKDQIY
jgi:hypothetical protein